MYEIDPSITIKGWGGELMSAEGAEILMPLERLAFMGFWEVLKNIFTIKALFKNVKKDIIDFNPDAIILVDYPGFNLRIAKWAKVKGIKVFYYISPQLWAWNTKRVEIIRECVEKIFVIFPFEKTFYLRHQINATYIGNPIASTIQKYQEANTKIERQNFILLMPGSRKQEIVKILPTMIALAQKLKEEHFVVVGVKHLEKSIYSQIIGNKNISLEYEDRYKIIQAAKLAIVASGTATLEVALFDTPQIVVYKTSWVSYQIAKRLIQVPFISIVNLIAGKKIVIELIQQNYNVDSLENSINETLEKQDATSFKEYKKQLIEENGVLNAAQEIFQYSR